MKEHGAGRGVDIETVRNKQDGTLDNILKDGSEWEGPRMWFIRRWEGREKKKVP